MRRAFIRFVVLTLISAGVAIAATSAGTWLDVPFVKQDKNGCGPAAIAMVIRYWQNSGAAGSTSGPLATANGADLDAIERAVYSSQAKGTRGSDMKSYFEHAGFRAFVFKGDWADLEEHLAKGRPLIVALGEPHSFHYVVVSGLDPQQGVVLVNDPAQRKLLKVDRAPFEEAWTAGRNWTLLALPGQQQ